MCVVVEGIDNEDIILVLLCCVYSGCCVVCTAAPTY